jgi:hypothetical protein
MEYSGARPAVAIFSANRPGTQLDANGARFPVLTIFSASRILGASAYIPASTSRSTLEKAKRPGDLRRSTFSWCRSTRISASRAARDRKSPTNAHQISLQRSTIGREHQPIRAGLPAGLGFR